jgi:hypothetical protein
MSNSEHSNWEGANVSNRGSNRSNSNSNTNDFFDNYEEPPETNRSKESRLSSTFSNMSNQRPTIEDVKYLVKTIGFSRVQTKTPGERLFAHVVKGGKEWIPIYPTGRQNVAQAIFQMYRSKPPPPSPIPPSFIVKKLKTGYSIREVIPYRQRPLKVSAEKAYVSVPRGHFKSTVTAEEYDPHYESKTKWGIRPKGWTQKKEDYAALQGLIAHAHGVLKRHGERSIKARERWKMAGSRFRESEERNRERNFNRRRVENKVKREEIKRAYRARKIAPVNTSRIPTRSTGGGVSTRNRRAETISSRKLSEKEGRVYGPSIMVSRKEVTTKPKRSIIQVPIRPTRWTDTLFVSGKKCASYTKLELSKLMRKYGEDPVGKSQAQMCDKLEQIYLSLKNSNS